MSMIRSTPRLKCILALVAGVLIAGATSALAASTEADFKAAFAAAEAADKEAAGLRNQWTTTAAVLADAKKAADKGDFDAAVGVEGSRSPGKSLDLPGDQRNTGLEGAGNTLAPL